MGATVYEKGISLGGVSKWGSLAGIRIGWIASQDPQVMEAVAQLKDYTTISASRPAEVLASIGIRNRGVLVQQNKDIIYEGKSYLKSFVQHHHELFEWVEPEGGSFAFVKLAPGISASAYTAKLAEEAGLSVMPSDLFVEAGNEALRVCFGRSNAPEMIDVWDRHIAEKK